MRWTFELTGAECEGQGISLDELRAMKPYLFAGIGSYPRLLKTVEDAGIRPCGDYNFGDHFDYDKLDIDMLRRMAAARKADCYLTTAKDAVKLSADDFDKPLYSLHLTVRPLESERLRDIIAKGLS